jgi:hypothetical protein
MLSAYSIQIRDICFIKFWDPNLYTSKNAKLKKKERSLGIILVNIRTAPYDFFYIMTAPPPHT